MKNQINLTGTLGHDGSFKAVGEKQVVNFSVAETFFRNSEKGNETQWWECSMWLSSNQAQYYQQRLKKGLQVAVRGFLLQEKVEKDGASKTYYKLQVYELDVLNVRIDNSNSITHDGTTYTQQQSDFDSQGPLNSPAPSDDLPF